MTVKYFPKKEHFVQGFEDRARVFKKERFYKLCVLI